MRVGTFLVAASLVLGMCAMAQASITGQWVQVPITVTTDSQANITGYQSWDLVITVSSDDDWQAARIYSNPPTTVFHHPFGNNTDATSFGPPNPSLIPSFPTLQYTSYVQTPGGGNATILGSTDGVQDFPPVPGTFMYDNTRIQMTFGDLASNLGQGGTLVRFTFLDAADAPPTFSGLLFSLLEQDGVPLPQIGGGGPVTTPEPASLGLLAIAGIFGLRRRA